jgi:hypothetical protein
MCEVAIGERAIRISYPMFRLVNDLVDESGVTVDFDPFLEKMVTKNERINHDYYVFVKQLHSCRVEQLLPCPAFGFVPGECVFLYCLI